MTTQSPVEYRDVVDCPGYRIGSDGSVWSCWAKRGRAGAVMTDNWKQLKPGKGGHYGHKLINLRGVNKMVHRMVLEAFVGPCPEGMETRHLDGDGGNNQLDNLVWGTPLENCNDRRKMGRMLIGMKFGSEHKLAKLNEEKVMEIHQALLGGARSWDLGIQYGVHHTTINAIRQGYSWGHITGRPNKKRMTHL